MRHSTVLELADEQGIWLPEALTAEWPPALSAADEKGWFRFQRLYDIARSVVTTEAAVRRLLLEAAEDEAAEGSRWLEIQVDPSGYAAHFGGITAFTDLVLDAARAATRCDRGLGVELLIAANRTRHPLDARTLARLAAQYAGRGVVGFGLSNDERRGEALAFAKAFDIATRAGLLAAPHGRRALRSRKRLVVPGRPRRAPDRPWGPVDRGPDAGRAHRRRGRHARDLSAVQRRARGLSRPGRGAVARAVRCRRADRPRRRRPVAVRLTPGRPVRGGARRPRLHRRRVGRAGPDVRSADPQPPTTSARTSSPRSTRWLTPHLTRGPIRDQRGC